MDEAPFLGLLNVLCGELEAAGLKYALTGSVVSSIYGEPYTSMDVDVCLRMTPAQAAALAASLPPRFYRSAEALAQAARQRGIANLIDLETGLKADLSVLPDEPYFDEILRRRQKIEYHPSGPAFWTVSAEDIVVMKLLWRKDSRSQKQWDNALSVVRQQGPRLDWAYMREWGQRLELASDLQSLQKAAGI